MVYMMGAEYPAVSGKGRETLGREGRETFAGSAGKRDGNCSAS